MNDEYGNTADDTNDGDSDDTNHGQDVFCENSDDNDDDSDDGDDGDIDNNDDERNWDDNNNDFDVKYTYHLFLNDKIAASVPKCTRFPVIICE